jgi:hypothetical protein
MGPKSDHVEGKVELEQTQGVLNDVEVVVDGSKIKQERPSNPWEHASFFSKLLFIWPYPLLQLGMTRPLEPQDLPEIPQGR